MMWEYQVTAEMYEQMKDIDIRSVDPATVLDIRDIRVDPSLPPAERIREAARCQRQFEIVRKRRRNFVVFRRGGNKTKRFLAQKECSRFAVSDA